MPNEHTISFTLKTEGGSIKFLEKDLEVGKSINVEEVIPSGSTDLQVEVTSGALADIKGLGFGVRKPSGAGSGDVSLTVKTNSTSSPDDTFELTTAQGLSWAFGDPLAIPLSAAITTLYVTNTGEVDAELIIRLGVDPTP